MMNATKHPDKYCKAFFKLLLVLEMPSYNHEQASGWIKMQIPCTDFGEKLFLCELRFSSLFFNIISSKHISLITHKFGLPVTDSKSENLRQIKKFLNRSMLSDWYHYDIDDKLPNLIKKIPFYMYDSLLKLEDSQANIYLTNIINSLFKLVIQNKIINFDYSELEPTADNSMILVELYDNFTRLELLNTKEIKLSKKEQIHQQKEYAQFLIMMRRLDNLIHHYIYPFEQSKPEDNPFIQAKGNLKAQIYLLYNLVKHDFDFCQKSNFNKVYQKKDWAYYENKYCAYGLVDLSKSPQGIFILKYFGRNLLEDLYKNREINMK